MTNYSSGPFMKMSPSGIPGLLIVMGVLLILVPPFLFPVFVVLLIVVLVVGLHLEYKSDQPHDTPSVLGLESDRVSTESPPEPQGSLRRRIAPVLPEFVFTAIAVLLTLGMLALLTGGLDVNDTFSRLTPTAVILVAVLAGLLLAYGSLRIKRSRRTSPKHPSA